MLAAHVPHPRNRQDGVGKKEGDEPPSDSKGLDLQQAQKGGPLAAADALHRIEPHLHPWALGVGRNQFRSAGTNKWCAGPAAASKLRYGGTKPHAGCR